MKINFTFCKRCLYSSNHPLGLILDSDGICSGCRIHEEKDSLDWSYRFEKIKNIIKTYKSKKNNYDCIVPVSGGQDSYYIVHLVKNILKLNPLLVSYNKYFNTEIGIKNLSNLRIKFDCDIVFKNINPKTIKKITQYTLAEFGNIYWPILAGTTVFPLEISEKYQIPLIIWGAHQGMEQVGMFSHLDEVEMNRRYRHEHDLFGLEAEDLIKIDNNLIEDDVWQFMYPSDKIINKYGIRGIYLGNYFRWDPYHQHKMMVKMYKYKGLNFDRTFDIYDHVDCFNYMNLHDYLKLCKHGYSKITDHVSREIRHGRITRNQGIDLVQKYEQKKFKYNNLFCEWLGVDNRSLNFILDRFKNNKYWYTKDYIDYSFNGFSKNFKKTKNLEKKYSYFKFDRSKFKETKDSKYIIFGKGHP